MGVLTIYRLSEQVLALIEGGDLKAASSISINEIKIACGQVINNILFKGLKDKGTFFIVFGRAILKF